MEYCNEILHTHWYWQNVPHEIVKWHLWLVEFLPRFKFWKKWDYCKITFIIGRGFAKRQILKKWKWRYLLNWVEYFDRLLRKYWYYQDLAQEIVKCHFSSVEVLLSSKFWKSENDPISWTKCNIVSKFCIHIGILTRYSHEIVKWHWDWLSFCWGSNSEIGGARWLSGSVSDSGARGPGFETYLRRVVSLSKTLYSPKVLVNYPGSDGSVPTWLKNCWLGR